MIHNDVRELVEKAGYSWVLYNLACTRLQELGLMKYVTGRGGDYQLTLDGDRALQVGIARWINKTENLPTYLADGSAIPDSVEWDLYDKLMNRPNNYESDEESSVVDEGQFSGSWDDNDSPDFGADTFSFLTGGDQGDYEDWKEGGGDFGHLRDRLGY